MPRGQQQRPVVVQIYAEQSGDRLIVRVGARGHAIAAAGLLRLSFIRGRQPSFATLSPFGDPQKGISGVKTRAAKQYRELSSGFLRLDEQSNGEVKVQG
jgi:hypothetical protein